MKREYRSRLIVLVIAIVFGSGWMFGIKTQPSGEWKARLSSVQAFNRYSGLHKIVLKNSVLKNISLVGAAIGSGEFYNTDWDGVEFNNSKIESTLFEKGEYRSASFKGSVLRNVVFKNVTFYGADFGGAQLENVRFIKCNFGRAQFPGLNASKIEFVESVLEEVRFFDSEVDVKFVGSKLTEVAMMGTIAKEYLTISGSDVYDLDLGDSNIPYVEITDSTVKKTTFSSGKATKLLQRNLKGAMQTAGAQIDEILAENITTEVLFFAGTRSNSIKVSNVTVTESFNVDTKAGLLQVENSNIKSIWNDGSIITEWVIRNTELRGTSCTSSKIGKIHFENVFLNGKFNYKDTHAEHSELIDVSKGPNFEFRGDGGNVKF